MSSIISESRTISSGEATINFRKAFGEEAGFVYIKIPYDGQQDDFDHVDISYRIENDYEEHPTDLYSGEYIQLRYPVKAVTLKYRDVNGDPIENGGTYEMIAIPKAGAIAQAQGGPIQFAPEVNVSEVMTMSDVEYPSYKKVGYDLIANGDLVTQSLGVAKSQAVLISATSTDSNAFSISVEWLDDNGNTYQSETKSDTGISSSTEDNCRLIRKANKIKVTATDESGGGSNNINLFVDVHR